MAAKTAKAKQPEESPPPPRRTRWWLQPGLWLCLVCVTASVAATIWLPVTLPDLTTRPEYQFRMDDTRVTAPPTWVPRTLLADVLKAANLPETVSLLEPDLCRNVALAWERNPWVKEVKSVRITGEPALQVDVAYRTPVAFVEVPRGLYPIDAEGVLLPPNDFSISDTSRLPHLRGIKSQPRGAAGEKWGDPVVVAAAQLAMLLAPEQNLEKYWNRFSFVAIVAPEVGANAVAADQLLFEIETTQGSRILWGRPPGSDSLEPTAAVKLARLQDYVNRFGGLESATGPQRIDIRLFDGISLQPLRDVRFR